mmetsp:Transcript_14396/g.36826  ORF Transcript_14396/g.36826 Transcript_14396/m.36826 type:complete len:228 (+) Transcript_14396:1151-1834(+)
MTSFRQASGSSPTCGGPSAAERGGPVSSTSGMASPSSFQIVRQCRQICWSKVASGTLGPPGTPSSSCRLHGGQKMGNTFGDRCFHFLRHSGLMQTRCSGTNPDGSKRTLQVSQTGRPSMTVWRPPVLGPHSVWQTPQPPPSIGTMRAMDSSTSTTMQPEGDDAPTGSLLASAVRATAAGDLGLTIAAAATRSWPSGDRVAFGADGVSTTAAAGFCCDIAFSFCGPVH